MKNENKYQGELIKKIKERFPDCIVLKNDPNYIQGIPDLLILYKRRWASLECKRSSSEPFRPNQEYYITKMNGMSFSRAVNPENEEEVLNELEKIFSYPI